MNTTPATMRKMLSIRPAQGEASKIDIAVSPGSLRTWPRLLSELPHRPHLDAPKAGRRDLRGHLNGLVQVPRLDQNESAELLLGLGEGPIGNRQLAIPNSHGRRCANGLEGVG